MKMVMIGGALAMLAGGAYWQKDRLAVDRNVYGATPAKVFATLDQMVIPNSPQGPMGTLDITKSEIADTSITWSGSGAHAAIACTATLAPVGADSTRVDLQCTGGGPSEGAAAGMASNLVRFAMTEQVDSTLYGRPYDHKAVGLRGSMSMLANLPRMESDALKMDAHAQRDQLAQMEQRVRDAEGQTGASATLGQGVDPVGIDPTPAQ